MSPDHPANPKPSVDPAASEDFAIAITLDRSQTGWHTNGPCAAWVTVTHLPTMIQARAYHRQQYKARELALACVGLMLDMAETDQCVHPEALTAETIKV